MDPVAPTEPVAPVDTTAAPAAETTPTTPTEEVKPTTDGLPEKVDDNKEEVKDTQEPQKTEGDDDAKDLMDFLLSLSGDTPSEEPVKEEDADKDKDPFHNPNSEPEIFKKQIEAVTLERDEYKGKLEESKDVLTLIETDPAVKSFIKLVQGGTPATKIFADYVASRMAPTPETTVTAKGPVPKTENTAAELVKRMQAARQTRTKSV